MPKISFRIRSEKSQAGIYVYLYPSKKSRIEFPVGISIRTAYWDKRKMRMTDGAQEGVMVNNLALCKLALFHFASFFSKLTIFNF